MIFVLTGGMGAGKTLNALKQVRDLQLQTGRPVCYTDRIELLGPALEFGWKKIDFKDWEQEPDGTIFLIDEAHKDLPTRSGIGAPPKHVQNLAEHRHKGYDFFLVTQHPKNLDSFVRRLVGNPGWHKHLKRRSGAPLVTVLKWDSVYENCEKPNSGDSAEVTHVPYPKEVFGWYKSASIHTAKFKIPKAFWMFAGGLVAVAVLLGFAYMKMRSSSVPEVPAAATPQSSSGGFLDALTKTSAKPASEVSKERRGPLTALEYYETTIPRVAGIPHTAPRYDELTKPRQVPYPAACVEMGTRCQCFSPQATPLNMDATLCHQIVKQGVFLDFLPTETERRRDDVALQRQQRQNELGSALGLQGGQQRAFVGQQNGMATNAPIQSVPMPDAHVPDYAERKAAENALVVSRLKPNYPGR